MIISGHTIFQFFTDHNFFVLKTPIPPATLSPNSSLSLRRPPSASRSLSLSAARLERLLVADQTASSPRRGGSAPRRAGSASPPGSRDVKSNRDVVAASPPGRRRAKADADQIRAKPDCFRSGTPLPPCLRYAAAAPVLSGSPPSLASSSAPRRPPPLSPPQRRLAAAG